MKVSVTTIGLSELDVDLLLLPVSQELTKEERDMLADAAGAPAEMAEADVTGEVNSSVLIYPDGKQARRVAVLGMGKPAEIDAERQEVNAHRDQ